MSSSIATTPSDSTTLLEDDHSLIIDNIINIPRNIDLVLSKKCCIYIVPEDLRQVNPEAFTPQLISIGPIHCNNKKLKPMEKQKQVYFHYFWERLRSRGQNGALEKLQEYKKFLMENEEEICLRYSKKSYEIVNGGENNFVNMILMDSIFIMELFLRNLDENEQKVDYMFTKSWLLIGIHKDLFLLENQLPFFVLEKLHSLIFSSFNDPSFLDLALNYFKARINGNRQDLTDVQHFTDLVRQTFRPSLRNFGYSDSHVQKGATKLKEAGISFENAQRELEDKLEKQGLNLQEIQDLLEKLKMARISTTRVENLIVKKIEEEALLSRRKVDDPLIEKLKEEWISLEGVEKFSKITSEEVEKLVKLKKARISFKDVQDISLLDIKFEKADFLNQFPCLSCLPYSKCVKSRLRIPQFTVDDTTECIFRNLIAYEQCHDPEEAYICNYVSLLDSLISAEEDVELLVQSKAIDHVLGSNQEMAHLINNLCKNVVIYKDCYSHIIKRLDDHYYNSWNRNIATIRSTYFPNLWRASSTVVGIAVLILTILSLSRSVFS